MLSYFGTIIITSGYIPLLLLIGIGLMYSNDKKEVTVGSIIALISCGLSAFLGLSALSLIRSYFVEQTFFIGLLLLLGGGISGLAWKPTSSPPSPSSNSASYDVLPPPHLSLGILIYQKPSSNIEISEIEEKIKKVKEFLMELEKEESDFHDSC
ncbi:MAG: hypothetical protein NDP21_05930 [Crenarchaeota archaeon]|nr:hypothetical protein [Thermoproteota archaeon]